MSKTPVEMERAHNGRCIKCGLLVHEHEKKRVYSEKGRWHHERYCPEVEIEDGLLDALKSDDSDRSAREIVGDYFSDYEEEEEEIAEDIPDSNSAEAA